nr:N-acetylgalactosamine kinase-like [Loxodonta africana]
MAAEGPATRRVQVAEYPRLLKLKEMFNSKFGSIPKFYVRAPGRVNIIGEHIDYCGYSVLPIAIEQDMLIAVEPVKHILSNWPIQTPCTQTSVQVLIIFRLTKPSLCGTTISYVDLKEFRNTFGLSNLTGMNLPGRLETSPPSSGSLQLQCSGLLCWLGEREQDKGSPYNAKSEIKNSASSVKSRIQVFCFQNAVVKQTQAGHFHYKREKLEVKKD